MVAMYDQKLVDKAKRRIKRHIATGEHVARVRESSDTPNLFEYRTKHKIRSLWFKKDSLGRLRLVK